MREHSGRLCVLDINPNPDINNDSGFMKQAYGKGYTYTETVARIVNAALKGR